MNRSIRHLILLPALALLPSSVQAQEYLRYADKALSRPMPSPAWAPASRSASAAHSNFGADADSMLFHSSLVSLREGQARLNLDFEFPRKAPQGPLSGYSKLYAGVFGLSRKTFGVEGKTTGVNAYTELTTTSTAAGVYGFADSNAPGVFGRSTAGDGGLFSGGGSGNGIVAAGGDTDLTDKPGVGGYFYGGHTESGKAPAGAGVVALGGYGAGYDGDVGASGVGISATGGESTNANGADGGDFTGGLSAYLFGGYGIYATGGLSQVDSGLDPGYVPYPAPAAYFNGDVIVKGSLKADSKDFQIDDPRDPANKYLNHASIESSEQLDMYSGNITTDAQGQASVRLPSWFQTLNGDLRYQLTTIGKKAQAWISEEAKDGSFKIASDTGNVKVSWQISGVRQDPWAKAHPLVVEQEKKGHERGLYKHPELYGQPPEKQTEWARHPAQARSVRPIARVNKTTGR